MRPASERLPRRPLLPGASARSDAERGEPFATAAEEEALPLRILRLLLNASTDPAAEALPSADAYSRRSSASAARWAFVRTKGVSSSSGTSWLLRGARRTAAASLLLLLPFICGAATTTAEAEGSAEGGRTPAAGSIAAAGACCAQRDFRSVWCRPVSVSITAVSALWSAAS